MTTLPSRAGLLKGAVLSAACTLFFATHVYVAYVGIRAKVVRTAVAATGGAVSATATPDVLKELQAPFAVIARIKNDAGENERFDIQVDGATVCEPSVAARSTHRVDCVLDRAWSSGITHAVTVRSPGSQWALEYLEFSTHHGSASGIVRFMVLPAISKSYSAPTTMWVAFVWLLLTGIFCLPAPVLPRWLSALHWAVVGILATLGVAFAVMPWVSAYTVVVESGSFVTCLVLLTAPLLYAASRGPVTDLLKSPAARSPVVRAAVVAILVTACFASVVQRRRVEWYGGNYSGFLHVSEANFDRNPLLNKRRDVRWGLRVESGGGYDGQFMYFAAFDPFVRAFSDRPSTYREIMDAPPYRFGRIGYVWLTKVFSFGRWSKYPATMTWLLLVALGVSAMAIGSIARGAGASPAWGLTVLCVPGFWESIQTSLPEPVAAALILGGCWCLTEDRWRAAAACFGFSLLVRETGVVAVLAFGAAAWFTGRRKEAIIGLLIALLPVIAWRLYLGVVLFPDWGWEGFFNNPHDLGWPFAGFADMWAAVRHGQYFPDLTRSAILYPVVLTAAFGLAIAIAVRRPSPASLAAVFYGAVAISLNYEKIWLHVGNGTRGTYEVFVLLALASTTAVTLSRTYRTAVRLFWAAAALYVGFGGIGADYIRDTFLPFLR